MYHFLRVIGSCRLLACHDLKQICTRKAQIQTPRLTGAVQKPQTFREKGYILLVIPATAFCLGTWQVQRRSWKLNLIKSLEEKTQSPPVPLPDNLDEVAELEYRPIVVRGTFDHSREMFIGPRTNVYFRTEGLKTSPRGFNVITPFKLTDRDETILVNRGWIPDNKVNPMTRQASQVQGEVELTGIVRLEERPPVLSSIADPKKDGYFLFRDVSQMAELTRATPIFIDQDLNSSVPGGPIGGQTRVTLRNEHFAYILTWYSLSAITFWMWYVRYRRPPPPISAFEYVKKSVKL